MLGFRSEMRLVFLTGSSYTEFINLISRTSGGVWAHVSYVSVMRRPDFKCRLNTSRYRSV